jgi:hypothetical protein
MMMDHVPSFIARIAIRAGWETGVSALTSGTACAVMLVCLLRYRYVPQEAAGGAAI